MNKYVYLTFGLIFLSVTAQAASCANGAGTTITGVDGYTYCKSLRAMNWWSAFAWCEGANMTLISLEDCDGVNGNLPGDVACPNFKNKGSGTVWTSSVPSKDGAYTISLNSGSVDNASSRPGNLAALCK